MTKFTLQDKIAHLEAYAASGLKKIEYAALHNINFNSFKCWPYIVKQATLLAHAAHHNQQDPDGSSTQSEPNVTKKDHSATAIAEGMKSPVKIVPVKIVESTTPQHAKLRSDESHILSKSKLKTQYHGQPLKAYDEFPKQPPPEVTVVLPSGLQVKCDVLLLSQVMEVIL